MKSTLRTFLFGVLTQIVLPVHCQLSGTVSVPGTYSTLGAAINDLNAQGVNGPLTVEIAAGHTETVNTGGFTLTASGTATSTIIFKKYGLGLNPVLIAYQGNKTPGAAIQDGLWRLAGCDHVTIDGIDFMDPNQSNPATMEFGVGLFKLNAIDGCHSITIQNCNITLNRTNNAGGSGPAADGSRGIEAVNATMGNHNTHLTILSADGSHSNNKFRANSISNCNIGISMAGYAGVAPYTFCDQHNEIGGPQATAGNTIVNFGGGGAANAAAAVQVSAQYDHLISGNLINNNTGAGISHLTTLRGIQVLDAPEASHTVTGNTITLHGGGSNSQLVCISNQAGASGTTNTVQITHNVISGCSYSTATSGSFYGIWNSASTGNLLIAGNRFINNSTGAGTGSTYLIYNNGAVHRQTSVRDNVLTFIYNGAASYSGTMYGIYNTAAAINASVSLCGNTFRNFSHVYHEGNGNMYFISNTASCSQLEIDSNSWRQLTLNHSNNLYFIYNNSATQNLLTVRSNTVKSILRTKQAENMYCYYANASVPGNAKHLITSNLFSDISATIAGTGSFYGIYTGEGNNSPYPQKIIMSNTVTGITMSGTGTFYGIYATDLGDAGNNQGSQIAGNVVSSCSFTDLMYGIYCAAPVSPSYAAVVRGNIVRHIEGSGTSSSVYGFYLGSNNSGVFFERNLVSKISTLGTSSAVYGLYCASTSTSVIKNNLIGHIESPNSGGANKSNGIYISTGSYIECVHNTVFLNTSSSGLNFSSNALYASSTASLLIRNNILVNQSTSTGSGITAAYRRSSTSMTNYLTASDHNLFYAGPQSGGGAILYSGSGYNTLAGLQAYTAPREAGSISEVPPFVSLDPLSQNYLHLDQAAASAVESSGGNSPNTVIDFDEQPRFGSSGYIGNGSGPDIGADEFEQDTLPCVAVNAATPAAISYSVCSGQTVILTSQTSGSGRTVTHQWKTAAAPGGPYTATGISGLDYYTGPLNAGLYYFILESTCSSNSIALVSPEVTVAVQATAQPTLMTNNSAYCRGDSILLSAVTKSGTSSSWKGPGGFFSDSVSAVIPGADFVHSGIYTLDVNTNGCQSSPVTLTVSVQAVSLTLSSSRYHLCTGDSAIVTASGSATSYMWSQGAVSASVILSPTTTGFFKVTATDAAGCSAEDSLMLAVIDPTISANNFTLCGSAPVQTLSVDTFTPSEVSWYVAPNGTIVIGTGNSHTVSGSASQTLFAQAAGTEADSVFTAMDGTDLHEGIMFNIIALQDLQLNGFGLHLPAVTNYSIEVWQRTGSYQGFTNTVAGWSSSGSCTVQGAGAGQLTALPLKFQLTALAGQTVAVYIAVVSGSLVCTGSNTVPVVLANNDLQITAGHTGSYFNTGKPGNNWNGSIHYTRLLCSSPRIPVTLLVEPLPDLMVNASPSVVCPGETATLVVSGAQSYKWTGTSGNSVALVSPTVSTTYSVKGTDVAGCSAGKTITVLTFNLPTLSIVTGATLVCPSAAVSFSATGAGSYVWSTGATGPVTNVFPAQPATYTLYGTSTDGCIGTETIAVSTKSVPVIKIVQSRDSICPFEPVILKASGAAGYTWLPGFKKAAADTVHPAATAVYNVIGQSVNSCTQAGIAYVFVDQCLGYSALQAKQRYEIFPNPSQGFFTISVTGTTQRLFSIYSAAGQPLKEWKSEEVEVLVNISEFAGGLYFLLIRETDEIILFRILKE